jgi:hypothetical protein
MGKNKWNCMEGETWVHCHYVRFLQRDACVVKIESSGALVHIKLTQPVDVSRACLVTAIYPVPARVCLGRYSEGCYHDCKIEIDWQAGEWGKHQQVHPPPTRFERSNKSKGNKRQRKR